MHARITLIRANAPARQFDLDPARDYLIGRSAECDICIDHEELSRRHARVSTKDDGWQIHDLNSKNGMAVGGRPLAWSRLTEGAWIGLGSLIMRFDTLSKTQLASATVQIDARRQMTMHGHREIDAAADVVDVLRKLLNSVLAISDTQRGFAMLTQPDGDLEVACAREVDCYALAAASFSGSRGAVRNALASGKAVVTSDATTHDALANRKSILADKTRALVCLPLVVLDRVVGVIYADSASPGKFFTELDLSLLEELSSHAALVIAAAQIGDQLDAVDRQLDIELVEQLAPHRDQISSVQQPVSGGRRVPLTGVRWSRFGSNA